MSLFAITPSNTTYTCRLASVAGSVRFFLYQAIPVGKKPPPAPLGFFSLIGPAMLQSCGTRTTRQEESSRAGCSPPDTSSCTNFHPSSRITTSRAAACTCIAGRVVQNPSPNTIGSARLRSLIRLHSGVLSNSETGLGNYSLFRLAEGLLVGYLDIPAIRTRNDLGSNPSELRQSAAEASFP